MDHRTDRRLLKSDCSHHASQRTEPMRGMIISAPEGTVSFVNFMMIILVHQVLTLRHGSARQLRPATDDVL